MRRASADRADEDWGEIESREDDMPLVVPQRFRDLHATRTEIKVRELWDSYCRSDLILQPDFQRNYVWDTTRASRYIESLLLRLPTPPQYSWRRKRTANGS